MLAKTGRPHHIQIKASVLHAYAKFNRIQRPFLAQNIN